MYHSAASPSRNQRLHFIFHGWIEAIRNTTALRNINGIKNFSENLRTLRQLHVKGHYANDCEQSLFERLPTPTYMLLKLITKIL